MKYFFEASGRITPISTEDGFLIKKMLQEHIVQNADMVGQDIPIIMGRVQLTIVLIAAHAWNRRAEE